MSVQKSTMNWDDVRLFLAVARTGSARAAAQALALSHTTVTRRVEQLEAELQTRLFDRDVRGFRLTDSGEAMMSSATRAEEFLLAAERALQGKDAQLTGEIRLTSSGVLISHLMLPGLVEFARQYPEIELNIMQSDNLFDLSRREADVAIRALRAGSKPPEDLIGRKVLTLRSCYYATDDYLAVHDPRAKNSTARWIGWGDRERFPDWVKASPFPRLPAHSALNDPIMQAEAAARGMGLAVLPCFMGDRYPGLRRIPGCAPYENYDLWILSHPDLRDTARLRVFRQFCVDLLEQNRALLTGGVEA